MCEMREAYIGWSFSVAYICSIQKAIQASWQLSVDALRMLGT